MAPASIQEHGDCLADGENQGELNASASNNASALNSALAPNSASAPSNAPAPKKKSSWLSFFAMLALVVLISFGLRTFVFQPFEIPSGSMEETIVPGDMVFSEKVSYYFRVPEQGDIVTFEDPTTKGRTLIKRCIAVGGQTVDLRDGVVYVDDQPLSEEYTNGKPSYPLRSEVTYPYTVPSGYIWVMGDNRTSSQDSRYFGAVPVSSVSGRAFFTYWPLSSIGLLD